MSQRTPKRGILLLLVLVAALGIASGAVALMTGGEKKDLVHRSPGEQLTAAKVAFAEGRFEHAEDLLRSLLGDSPEDVDLKVLLGRTLLELGRVTEARSHFDAVHKAKPETVEALLGLAACHDRMGEYNLSSAVLKRASEMRKGDWKILREYGLALYKQGDSMGALFAIRNSLKQLKGQEDLSRLLNEIGTARQARASLPDHRSKAASFDPFEDFAPRGHDARDFRPGPEIPDPLRGLPHPGIRDR